MIAADSSSLSGPLFLPHPLVNQPHTSDEPDPCRFAPNLTGPLYIGGVRLVLFVRNGGQL